MQQRADAAGGIRTPELRGARRRKGYSIRDLAGISGVAPSTIQAIETGRRKAHGRTVRKLAAALQTTPEALMGDAAGGPGSGGHPPRRSGLGLPREERVRLAPGESIEDLVSATRGE